MARGGVMFAPRHRTRQIGGAHRRDDFRLGLAVLATIAAAGAGGGGADYGNAFAVGSLVFVGTAMGGLDPAAPGRGRRAAAVSAEVGRTAARPCFTER
jgi:hypothetical protein